MNNKSSAMVTIFLIFIIIIMCVAGFFVAKKYISKNSDDSEGPTTEVIFSAVNVLNNEPIDAHIYIEEKDNEENFQKDAELSKESATSVFLPQNKTYRVYFVSEGFYGTKTGFFIPYDSTIKKISPVSLYPFATKIKMIKHSEFFIGENKIRFSIETNGGWLRRSMICVAWSPSFVYAEINPYEIKCIANWVVWPDGLYTCDNPDQSSMSCSYLKDLNHTCVLDNVQKPQRLITKVDFCSNFEKTLIPGGMLNFTVKYKLYKDPTHLDYLRFYVIDKDKTKGSNWEYTYEDISGADIALDDKQFEFFVLN